MTLTPLTHFARPEPSERTVLSGEAHSAAPRESEERGGTGVFGGAGYSGERLEVAESAGGSEPRRACRSRAAKSATARRVAFALLVGRILPVKLDVLAMSDEGSTFSSPLLRRADVHESRKERT